MCSGVVSGYKGHTGNAIPLITCLTDVTSHSEWIHPGTDFYLAPSPEARQALADKGVDPDRILAGGIPVRDRFDSAGRRQDGPRQLLIMGGGLGLMPRKDSFCDYNYKKQPHGATERRSRNGCSFWRILITERCIL